MRWREWGRRETPVSARNEQYKTYTGESLKFQKYEDTGSWSERERGLIFLFRIRHSIEDFAIETTFLGQGSASIGARTAFKNVGYCGRCCADVVTLKIFFLSSPSTEIRVYVHGWRYFLHAFKFRQKNNNTAMSSISNVENLSPQIIRRVAKEMSELSAQPPEGIRVILNEEDVTDIQAVIEGPAGTPYADGYFRVKLALGKDFPQGPPKAFFLTKIFHPNVAKNGEICVNTLKKDWKSDLGIKHILLTVKCLLIVPNAESALNEEAGKMLLERYDDYSARAKMMTEIHAQGGGKGSKAGLESCASNVVDGPLAKKHAGDKKLTAEKKKMLKEKKRTLKRL